MSCAPKLALQFLRASRASPWASAAPCCPSLWAPTSCAWPWHSGQTGAGWTSWSSSWCSWASPGKWGQQWCWGDGCDRGRQQRGRAVLLSFSESPNGHLALSQHSKHSPTSGLLTCCSSILGFTDFRDFPESLFILEAFVMLSNVVFVPYPNPPNVALRSTYQCLLLYVYGQLIVSVARMWVLSRKGHFPLSSLLHLQL